MKKLSMLFITFLTVPFLSAPLAAQDGGWRMPNRGFEIGLAHTSFGFSNDFLSAADIFQETAVIDIDKLKNGFNLHLDAGITPFYIQYNNTNDNWGFGFSLNASFTGILGLNGSMITFAQATDARSDVGGAAFIDANMNIYFPISKLKVRIAPSVFYPAAFITAVPNKPIISYTNNALNGETLFNLNYNLRVYTPFQLDSFDLANFNFANLNGEPGVDVNLGLEFPLGDALGWTKGSHLLDFTIGLDVYNLPLLNARLDEYIEVSGQIGSDNPIDIFSDGIGGLLDPKKLIITDSGKESVGILRPFKMLLWAQWQPFGPFLSFTPIAGFSINPFYIEQFSLEYGIKARLDLGNIFIVTYGTGYYDRFWKNSLDIALNLRLIEINLGVDLRSPDFLKSWQGSGLGVNVGIKLGW